MENHKMNDKELLLAKLKEEKFYLEAKYLGAQHLAAELIIREDLHEKNIFRDSKIKIYYSGGPEIGIYKEVRAGYTGEPVLIWRRILKSGKTSKMEHTEDRPDVIKNITRVK